MPTVVSKTITDKEPNVKYTGYSIHPKVDSILDETYGIIVFQEDLMRLYALTTNKTFADADIARKAVAKYKPDDKKTHEPFFEVKQDIINGLVENFDMAQQDAEDVVGAILKDSGYSFNRSHAIAYSYLTMDTLYWKLNYRAPFYAALLNSTSDPNKKQSIFYEIIEEEIEIRPPDINKSDPIKYIADNDEGVIYLPLTSLSGISDRTALEISVNRPYTKPSDFTNKVNTTVVNSSNRATLFIAGVFDKLGGTIEDYDIDHKSLLYGATPLGELNKNLRSLDYPRGNKQKFINHIYNILSNIETPEYPEFDKWIKAMKKTEFRKLFQALTNFCFGYDNVEMDGFVYKINKEEYEDALEFIDGKGSRFDDKETKDMFCYNVVFPTAKMLQRVRSVNNKRGWVAGQVQKVFVDKYGNKETIKFYLHNNYRIYVQDWKPFFSKALDVKEGDWIMASLWKREDGSYSNHAESFYTNI